MITFHPVYMYFYSNSRLKDLVGLSIDSTTIRLRTFRLRTSTVISSTDISSTTVYQRTRQLYIQLLFQQITIFINSNFYLGYTMILFINPTSTDPMIIQHI